jgi:hypothetical protein
MNGQAYRQQHQGRTLHSGRQEKNGVAKLSATIAAPLAQQKAHTAINPTRAFVSDWQCTIFPPHRQHYHGNQCDKNRRRATTSSMVCAIIASSYFLNSAGMSKRNV